jgi:acetyl esterase/lipase
VNRYADI